MVAGRSSNRLRPVHRCEQPAAGVLDERGRIGKAATNHRSSVVLHASFMVPERETPGCLLPIRFIALRHGRLLDGPEDAGMRSADLYGHRRAWLRQSHSVRSRWSHRSFLAAVTMIQIPWCWSFAVLLTIRPSIQLRACAPTPRRPCSSREPILRPPSPLLRKSAETVIANEEYPRDKGCASNDCAWSRDLGCGPSGTLGALSLSCSSIHVCIQ